MLLLVNIFDGEGDEISTAQLKTREILIEKIKLVETFDYC